MKPFIAITTAVLMTFCWCSIDSTISPHEALGQNDVPKKAPTAGSKNAISLQKCRIKLIDEVTLASDRPGILKFVEPEEGDFVSKDQEIARLIDDAADAARNVAEHKAANTVQIRFAKKAAALADTELQIGKDTNFRLPGTVPEIEIERLKLAYEKSFLQIEQADEERTVLRLNLKEAEAQLDTYRIKAPFDGTVVKVYKQKGEAVRQGDEILSLVSTRRVKVEGYVKIQDIWNVKPGAPVTVRLNIPGIDRPEEKIEFLGRIKFVDVGVNPVTREARVWAEVNNRDNILRTGLTATMTIDLRKQVAQQK